MPWMRRDNPDEKRVQPAGDIYDLQTAMAEKTASVL